MIRFRADHRFLVTGASAGIGRSIAHLLNELGATVIGIGRSEERLTEVRTSASAPERLFVEIRDLSVDVEGLDGWVRDLAGRYGPFRGLVHSAGAMELAPLRSISLVSARKLFDVNFFAALLLSKGFCENGVHDGIGSAIVFISSGSALRGLAAASTYSASKGALNAATRALAREVAAVGVRVNTILPGLVDTPMTRRLPDGQIQFLLGQQFLAGLVGPAEIASSCVLLLSDSARFMTGECLTVDAGSGMKVQPG